MVNVISAMRTMKQTASDTRLARIQLKPVRVYSAINVYAVGIGS
jgi:hypothetical protein